MFDRSPGKSKSEEQILNPVQDDKIVGRGFYCVNCALVSLHSVEILF